MFIVDAHEDIAYHMSEFKRDFVSPDTPCQLTLPWLRDGGVRLAFNTVFIHPKHKPLYSRREGVKQLDIYDSIYSSHPETVMRVGDLADLNTLIDSEKIGLFTLMEGADPLESPRELDYFHERGVRAVSLSWNDQNKYASGHNTDDALSSDGKELLHVMNELKILLDLSHLNETGFWEAIEMTDFTPIATHSNARGLREHPRNLRDSQIKAIAERGGVVGVVFYGPFLRSGAHATIADIVSHIDYIASLVGEDHVGIGTDLDGAAPEAFPSEIKTIANVPKIAELLFDYGCSEDSVGKIMGGNFLRVIREHLAKSDKG